MPKINVKVPKLSGFDKSYQNLLTSKCGTLTPILCDELIPSSRVHLEDVISAKLPPLASDTFMRCNLKLEAFFVPTRLLYGGFASWITKESKYDPVHATNYNVEIPILNVSGADTFYTDSGTLADYLGVRKFGFNTSGDNIQLNIFPFLAYHRIYDDWYRNNLVQAPVFTRPLYGASTASNFPQDAHKHIALYSLPFAECPVGQTYNKYGISESFADGVALGSLRQRNFGNDYFTNALPNAQLGSAQSVSFSTSGNYGNFTIAALRAANSLQQFAERNQIAGPRLQDFVKANYGADLSSGVAQRSIYLGSGEIPVYSKGIYQNSVYNGSAVTQNPFEGSPAAQYGSVDCSGRLTLVEDFVAQEPGYLMVMASLVPIVTYSHGIERQLLRYNASNSQTDMATPLLQNVGNQPIYQIELVGDISNPNGIFGYTDRYGDFKHRNDELHGLLRDGESLQSFALQRSVNGNPTISSTFLQIPISYLDQVAAVAGNISNYGVWIDCFHSYKVSMPLASYSIPSLQDPAYEHGKDVEVEFGGSRIS